MFPMSAHVFRLPPNDFNPTVAVASCYIRVQEKYLFLQRPPHKFQSERWGIPAGKIEHGETAAQTMVRETYEEVGLYVDNKEFIDVGVLFVRYPEMDFTYHMFACEYTERPEIRISQEHQSYEWLTFDEALCRPLIDGEKEAIMHYRALSSLTTLPRKEFYFLRHGQTDVNKTPLSKRVDYDLPLNALGRQQAVDIRPLIDSLSVQTIYSSPLQRALETKEIIAPHRDYIKNDDLSECKAKTWMNMVQLEKSHGFELDISTEKFLSQVSKGMNAALKSEGPVLIVAHGGIHWALCYAMQLEDHPWKIGNCELVHFYPGLQSGWKASIKSAPRLYGAT